MTSSQNCPIHIVTEGIPAKMIRGVEIVRFVIHGFEDQQHQRGTCVVSRTVEAHGSPWDLYIYPRGNSNSSHNRVYISCELHLLGKEPVCATISFHCTAVNEKNDLKCRFVNGGRLGYDNCFVREEVIQNSLEDDGSLIIDCVIKSAVRKKRAWYPKELQQQDILVKLYQDASSETSDVVFSVGESLYAAHKNILAICGKKLYEIVNESDSDRPVLIDSIDPEIFKSILDFIYNVKTPNIENIVTVMKLLVAADRFECVHLKLYAESIIVDQFLTSENAAELFLFADSHCCALLKESATELFVTKTKEFKDADAWWQIEESAKLVKELYNKLSNEDMINSTSSDINQLDVITLRVNLDKANLQLDGSREMLIDRLKTYRQN